VPAFDHLGDNSSSDVREAPSSGTTMEKPVSPLPSASGEFLCFCFIILTVVPDDFLFADPARLVPLPDLPLENLDEDLEYYLRHVSFVFAFAFFALSWLL
jgi:hypothetical protein